MFEITDTDSIRLNGAKIKVVGVGGGGCNAVNTMIRSGLAGVEYVVANTDAQALSVSLAPTKIQLGGTVTKGLGAGANPEVGKKAALEDYERISEVLKGADMVFITAGMGGGTGTGAAPVIAKLAKELGALTVGVVTKPFVFEGKKRFKQAEEGIRNLEENVDSLISIPNQRLLYLAGENLSLIDTFKKADEVLLNAVRGISDLINNTGHINADFADVSTVMANKGLALMGTGAASGSGRAIKAATEAISSPLLEDVSINGATGIIINITGNETLSMHETNEAVTLIMEAADENAEIIFGTVIDNNCGDEVKITVIATGLGVHQVKTPGAAIAHGHHAVAQQPVAREEVAYSAPISSPAQVQASAEPMVRHESEMIQRSAPVESIESRDIFSTRKAQPSQSSVESEEKSDFDRFMTDRNSFSSQERVAKDEVTHSHQNENKAPSKLVQSIRDAANKYENTASKPVTGNSFSTPRFETEAMPQSGMRAKSIAEKLGFVNFDEDEFDTPSYLRKEEKTHSEQKPDTRNFKDFDL